MQDNENFNLQSGAYDRTKKFQNTKTLKSEQTSQVLLKWLKLQQNVRYFVFWTIITLWHFAEKRIWWPNTYKSHQYTPDDKVIK